MTLGQRIKAARTAAKLTQAQLAERCNWDLPSRLANYEQGIREPSLADLRIIANNVREGGHTYARIVLGDDVEASQPQRLDTEKLTDLLETVEAAVTQSRRQIPARTKARIVAALYADEQASAAASPQAVQSALSSILSSLSPEET
jgi:transcriptional regulator with XRE-family HTH domain